MSIRTATGLIAAYMRACGFAGWASFWNVIYVLPGFEYNYFHSPAKLETTHDPRRPHSPSRRNSLSPAAQ